MSVIVRADPRVRAAIAAIEDDAWTAVAYREAILDETTGTWISRDEVSEIPYTAFVGRKPANRCPAGWSCAASPT